MKNNLKAGKKKRTLGHPVVRALSLQCRESRFDSWLGNKIPHITWQK